MTRCLRELDALPMDPNGILSTHTVAHTICNSDVRGSGPFFGLPQALYACDTHTYMQVKHSCA